MIMPNLRNWFKVARIGKTTNLDDIQAQLLANELLLGLFQNHDAPNPSIDLHDLLQETVALVRAYGGRAAVEHYDNAFFLNYDPVEEWLRQVREAIRQICSGDYPHDD